jgi:hypothetical protein
MSNTEPKAATLAIQHSDKERGVYAVFRNDGGLYIITGKEEHLLAHPDNIKALDDPIEIYYHHPYVCVTERFGLNAALVDIRSRNITKFSREDHEARVSSYSIGFLERNGHTLLIHQTEWNRLDITDLDTGILLTDREIKCDRIETKKDDGTTEVDYVENNYLEHFYSLLHVSPDYKSFLSNGWIWTPVDNIICFRVDDFLERWDPSAVQTGYFGGYNWDRPCTFIDNDTFVAVVDDNYDPDDDDRKELQYFPLHFYHVSDMGKEKYLEPFLKIECEAFALNEYREVKGYLYYDKTSNALVAMTPEGTYLVGTDGKVLRSIPDVSAYGDMHGDFGSAYALQGWKYNQEFRLFYRADNTGKIEELDIWSGVQ